MIDLTLYTHTVRRNPDPESKGEWDAWEVIDPDGDVVTCCPTRAEAESESRDYSRLLRDDLEYDNKQVLIESITAKLEDLPLEKLAKLAKMLE